MSGYFGIDLGTTNSVITQLVGGTPHPIPVAGAPIVPSVVLFDGDRVLVGREARNLELERPERVIRSVKRKMGQPHRYRVGTRELSPEDVSAEVLRALRRGAEEATGQPVRDVVITVPAYFDDAQRRATLRAGELAELNVLRLLNEPTSAALVYEQVAQQAAPDGPEAVLVYDLGGGTFDVSVLEVFDGVREVRATAGNTQLGGDDFDEMLVRLFLDELKRVHAADPRDDACAMARLRRVAEATKVRLSSETQVRVREEFLTTAGGKPVHLDLEVTRWQLEALVQPLLAATVELALRAVRDAGLTPEAIRRVCLVGGSTRIPRVRELLEGAFSAHIHEEIDPDLAVGLGASIQSALLQGGEVARILVDVAAHSLGIRALGPEDTGFGEPDTFAPILRRNTALPARRAEEFYTIVDGQEHLRVEVFQGEAARVSENRRVGSFEFRLEPAPESSPVQVEFAYDLNGVVNVSVAQTGTSNRKTVAMGLGEATPRPGEGASVESPLERRAARLLGELRGAERGELQALLTSLREAAGRGERETAEEALLDFFVAHETRDG
jgi:molecular chaperone DnaK